MNIIEKLAELEAKATPGPWDAATEKDKHAMVMALKGKFGDPDFSVNFVGWIPAPAPNGVNDAQFVVASRNAMPLFLELYRAVKAAKLEWTTPGITEALNALEVEG